MLSQFPASVFIAEGVPEQNGAYMFQAIVLQLQRDTAQPGELAGASLQALIVGMIKSQHPQLYAQLQQPAGACRYTVSLLREECTATAIAVRIATVDSALTHALLEASSRYACSASPLIIGTAHYHIGAVITDEQRSPWVGSATLVGLQPQPAGAEALLHIHIASALRSRSASTSALQGKDKLPRASTLADPVAWLFLAIAQRWRAAAPAARIPMNDEIRRAAAQVTVVRNTLRPAVQLLRAGAAREVGWGHLGELVIHPGEMPEHRMLLHTLANVAFYTGAGIATTRGMGLLRSVAMRCQDWVAHRKSR